MSKCLFCSKDLNPGSDEHVFLAALGGSLISKNATCVQCNNGFAKSEHGKVDDALAGSFEVVRCALLIRTGRDKPPPTIYRAGRIPDGPEFDLAPGFVPVVRAARVPDFLEIKGNTVTVPARDRDDAKRILNIAKLRGLSPTLQNAESVTKKPPLTKASISFEGPKVWRAITKSALVGSCVLYGNDIVRSFLTDDLRQAVRLGEPDISGYAGWDYVNPWPTVTSAVPHRRSPDAKPSRFDHSLMVVDVGDSLVAYVELFGAFRFSVRLGKRANIEPRGLALNPRIPGRLMLSIIAPESYEPRRNGSMSAEFKANQEGLTNSLARVLSTWNEEATHRHVENLVEDLSQQMAQAGDDEDARELVLAEWASRIARLELGHDWKEKLELEFFDDEPA